MQVGDSVLYVPGRAHAFDVHPDGQYSWVLGWRAHRKADVEELQGSRIREVLAHVRRLADPEAAQESLVLLRPQKLWPALVRAVHDDGTVALDVTGPSGGVTLHYDAVPVAPVAANQPHSCHLPPAPNA